MIMRKFFAILCLLTAFCLPAVAQNRIAITITITNSPYPTNGDTLTVNGDTRTWTNATPTATGILEDSSLGGCATNLFNAIANRSFTGPLVLSQPTSNSIYMIGSIGQAMAASLLTNWGSISYYTNTVISGVPVVIPISGEIQSATAISVASGIVAGVNAYASNVFLNSLLPSGVITNTNATIAGVKTNWNVGGTNAASWAYVTNDVTIGHDLTTLSGDITSGNDLSAAGDSYAGGTFYGGGSGITGLYASQLTGGTLPYTVLPSGVITNTNATSVILSSSLTVGGVTYPSQVQSGTYTGSNNWTGDIAYPGATMSGIANGGNADVPTGTNVFFYVSGPSGAFYFAGLAGGRDGRVITIENSTGYTMSFSNESGFESSSAANRILTGLGGGSGVTNTNNPGFVKLRYNGTSARWEVLP